MSDITTTGRRSARRHACPSCACPVPGDWGPMICEIVRHEGVWGRAYDHWERTDGRTPGYYHAGDAHRTCSVKLCANECVVIRAGRCDTRGWCADHAHKLNDDPGYRQERP